jgi:hypothetical protein
MIQIIGKNKLFSKHTWLNLLHFFFIWILSSAIFFAFIVFPFFSESINLASPKGAKDFANDSLFLLLSQFAALLGTLFTFWYKTRKNEKHLFGQLKDFDFSLFNLGGLLSIPIVTLWLAAMVFGHFISFSFSNASNLLIPILLFLIVAISEEVFFRGYVLNILKNSLGSSLGIFFSSLLFALVHIFNENVGLVGLINIFLFGIIAALLYTRSNNLSAPIGLHFTWNLAQSVFGFAVSGQKFVGVFSIQYNSNNEYLTGGEFGMEGSVVLTPIVLLFIFFTLRKMKPIALNDN